MFPKISAAFLTVATQFIGLTPLGQTAPGDPALSISGKVFYKDGMLWMPKGVTIEAFNRPAALRDKRMANLRSYFGSAELAAARHNFGANVARFQVSQPGLDPQSPIYDASYLTELLEAFQLAESSGFVVIISMDAQSENGISKLPCMPNDSTMRAWRSIAPYFRHDPNVILELFNEPCISEYNPINRILWAQSMQPIIDFIRDMDAMNILILDGLGFAHSIAGLFPLIHDRLPNKIALSVHPYLVKDRYMNIEQWREEFGNDAALYPVIAGEWNATPTGGCVGPATPAVALSLMRYLQSLKVGLIVWAIDSNFGPIAKDHIRYEPNDYSSFHDCNDGSVSGGGRLLADYPNN